MGNSSSYTRENRDRIITKITNANTSQASRVKHLHNLISFNPELAAELVSLPGVNLTEKYHQSESDSNKIPDALDWAIYKGHRQAIRAIIMCLPLSYKSRFETKLMQIRRGLSADSTYHNLVFDEEMVIWMIERGYDSPALFDQCIGAEFRTAYERMVSTGRWKIGRNSVATVLQRGWPTDQCQVKYNCANRVSLIGELMPLAGAASHAFLERLVKATPEEDENVVLETCVNSGFQRGYEIITARAPEWQLSDENLLKVIKLGWATNKVSITYPKRRRAEILKKVLDARGSNYPIEVDAFLVRLLSVEPGLLIDTCVKHVVDVKDRRLFDVIEARAVWDGMSPEIVIAIVKLGWPVKVASGKKYEFNDVLKICKGCLKLEGVAGKEDYPILLAKGDYDFVNNPAGRELLMWAVCKGYEDFVVAAVTNHNYVGTFSGESGPGVDLYVRAFEYERHKVCSAILEKYGQHLRLRLAFLPVRPEGQLDPPRYMEIAND